MYYAQIQLPTRKCFAVTETHSAIDDPTMIEVDGLHVHLLGKIHNAETGAWDDVVVPTPPHATKRAFQNRFPTLANGISTKWDALTRFLSSDSYAESIGVTGSAMHELRMLIETGVNRMTASPFVDLAADGEAAALTGLLTNPAIPEVFRLTATERDALLTIPLTDSERYKG